MVVPAVKAAIWGAGVMGTFIASVYGMYQVGKSWIKWEEKNNENAK